MSKIGFNGKHYNISDSDEDLAPPPKRQRTPERETNISSTVSEKCRSFYNWMMDIPSVHRNGDLSTEEFAELEEQGNRTLGKYPEIRREVKADERAFREDRRPSYPQILCYRDGTPLGSKPPSQNSYLSSRRAKTSNRKLPRWTAMTNQPSEIDLMLESARQSATDPKELALIEDLICNKPPRRTYRRPLAPADCKTNNIPEESHGNGMAVSNGSCSERSVSRQATPGSYTGSDQFTVTELNRWHEKKTYELLLRNNCKRLLSKSDRRKAPSPVVDIDLTKDSDWEVSLDDARPPRAVFEDSPSACDISDLDLSPPKRRPDVKWTPINFEETDPKPRQVTLQDILPNFKGPARLQDMFDGQWMKEMRAALAESTEKRMEKIRKSEDIVKRFTKRREAKLAEERCLQEKFKLLGVVFEEEKPIEEEKFPVITEEMEFRINYARSNGDPNETLTRLVLDDKSTLPISRKIFQSLRPETWLLDDALNSYLALIQKRSDGDTEGRYPKTVYFTTFFVASLSRSTQKALRVMKKKNIDIFTKDILLFPVHLLMHWVLVVVDNRDKTLKYYDSMSYHTPMKEHMKNIREYLNYESLDKRKVPLNDDEYVPIFISNCPKQKNGSDCGMFTLKYAEYLSRDAPLTFGQENMRYFRKRMVIEILDHQLM